MKVIQVILYLASVSHLVYCRALQGDPNTSANISRYGDCDSSEKALISRFNDIFIELSSNGTNDNDIKISNETVNFLNDMLINNATDQLEQVRHSINNTFSATCKRYTDVMAHKHVLQDLLFTMEDSLSSLNFIAKDITHVITKLEQAGCKLQNITLKYHGKPCVEFTADQYHEIYASRFHNESSVYNSLVFSVKLWRNKTDNCLKWKDYSYIHL